MLTVLDKVNASIGGESHRLLRCAGELVSHYLLERVVVLMAENGQAICFHRLMTGVIHLVFVFLPELHGFDYLVATAALCRTLPPTLTLCWAKEETANGRLAPGNIDQGNVDRQRRGSILTNRTAMLGRSSPFVCETYLATSVLAAKDTGDDYSGRCLAGLCTSSQQGSTCTQLRSGISI